MKWLSPDIMGLLRLVFICLFYEQPPLVCVHSWSRRGVVSTSVGLMLTTALCFACEFMDFFDLEKKIKSSAMRFHLSTFLFFSSTNWCWLAVRFEKMGLKDLFFYCWFGLCGITGSSGRSLFTEFVYPLFLDKERGKKMEWWAVIYWYCLLNWACFQFIAGNSAERSNSVLAFVKDKIKANAKVCVPF